MTDRPILMNAPMVCATLDGRKTQTRRLINGGDMALIPFDKIPSEEIEDLELRGWREWIPGHLGPPCPHGQPGDRLWVRETWQAYRQVNVEYNECEEMESPKDRHHGLYEPVYRADGKSQPNKWFPAIHLPRELSRITLEITKVRVERLHGISRGGAMAEGCPFPNMADGDDPRTWFAELWQSINGPESWAANPLVWVIEFKRVTR